MISNLEVSMRHPHIYSVDALRRDLKELRNIRAAIMRSNVESAASLDYLMEKARECVRGCLHPTYTERPQILPTPTEEDKEIAVTVKGVNLIFVCDISDSMFDGGGLEKGGRVQNLLVKFAKEIERYATKAKIPATCSLVAYTDPTDIGGKNRPVFWDIILNKAPISRLDDAFSSIDRGKWARGGDWEESGMTAIHKTLGAVMDKTVENSLILVSDERNKLHNSQHSSHPRFKDVTKAEFLTRVDSAKVKNRYALIPMKRGYIKMPTATSKGKVGATDYNRDVKTCFRQCKEYFNVRYVSELNNWVKWTLDPSKAPKQVSK